MQDRFETLSEVTRAEIVGAPEREIQINVDPLKMEQALVSFDDISNAIAYENMDISGGKISVGTMDRTLRIKGQISNSLALNNIIVKTPRGSSIYLKDIAQINDTIKLAESYARLNGKNVVTLNIVKRPGENLINCAAQIKKW